MPSVMTVQLPAAEPIRLPTVVQSHGWSELLPLEWSSTESVLRWAEQLGVEVLDLEVRQLEEGSLELTVHAGSALSAADLAELRSRVRWMLALDERLQEFYELCRDEPRLAHVPAEGKGRILRSTSLFEDAVKCICTTNTTWGQTKGMVRRLVERLGEPSALSGRRAFPTPQAIVSAGEAVLVNEVRMGYRAPYVCRLAKQVDAGELDLESLKQSDVSTSELRRELLEIKGVGPYAAAVLLVLLGRYDYIGVDSWARKLVSRQFHSGQAVGEKEVQAAFESFGRWRALAYWFYRYDEP